MEGCLHWRETNLEVSCRLIVAAIALDPGPIRVLHFDPKVVISYGVENPQGPSSRSNHCIQTPDIPVFFTYYATHCIPRYHRPWLPCAPLPKLTYYDLSPVSFSLRGAKYQLYCTYTLRAYNGDYELALPEG